MLLKKSYIYSFFEYLTSILLILDISCVWTRLFEFSDFLFQFLSLIPLIILILFRVKNLNKKNINLIILWILILGILIVSNMEYSMLNIEYFSLPLLVSLFYQSSLHKKDEKYSLLFKFSNVTLVICLISLFCYIFLTLLNLLPYSEVSFYWGRDVTCRTFFNIYYEAQTTPIFSSTFKVIRNCGIFCEAPMFSFVISIALLIELFLKSKKNFKKIFIFILTILTTFSTTGILLSLISLFIFIIGNIRKFQKKYHNFFMIMLPTIFIIFFIIGYIYIHDKMTVGELSFNCREDDIVSCLKCFTENPIFGVGFGNSDKIINYFSEWRMNNLGLSTGFFILLAELGLFFAIPLLFYGMKFCFVRYNNEYYFNINKFGFFFCFILIYIITNVPSKQIVLIIFSMFIINIEKNTCKNLTE